MHTYISFAHTRTYIHTHSHISFEWILKKILHVQTKIPFNNDLRVFKHLLTIKLPFFFFMVSACLFVHLEWYSPSIFFILPQHNLFSILNIISQSMWVRYGGWEIYCKDKFYKYCELNFILREAPRVTAAINKRNGGCTIEKMFSSHIFIVNITLQSNRSNSFLWKVSTNFKVIFLLSCWFGSWH